MATSQQHQLLLSHHSLYQEGVWFVVFLKSGGSQFSVGTVLRRAGHGCQANFSPSQTTPSLGAASQAPVGKSRPDSFILQLWDYIPYVCGTGTTYQMMLLLPPHSIRT